MTNIDKKTKTQIEELENTIATLRQSGSEMGQEIIRLKHVIGGYLTTNKNLRDSKIKLETDIKEAEKKLQEQKIEYETLIQNEKSKHKAQIEEKDKHAEKLADELVRVNERLESTTKTMNFYKANYEHYISLPWYKRLSFVFKH